jgi:hypothetical protein
LRGSGLYCKDGQNDHRSLHWTKETNRFPAKRRISLPGVIVALQRQIPNRKKL